ncbi:ABC transporter permease [Arthrobacter sp. ERGS1:01]|uniref:ABC transporter permease n=1 Tax=Arthrobacter sp. ERGS1:01 TaxID=1704044 RepID=UPI0006B58DE0|nr:ABC transporter permease [Arthrobacter sp. ERGS1:01]ALE05772.1 ABC transporter permease [Arthrobacter sp. ERGS1:01]
MLQFLLRKIFSGLVLTIVVTAVTFMLIFNNGPAIARQVLGQNATPDQVVAKVHELGLDQPVLLQYFKWLGNLVQGDLGVSYFTNEPITSMLSTRIPVTLSLVLVSLFFTMLISVIIGVAAAVRGGWLDRTLQFVSVAGSAIPNFVIAIALVFLFALTIPLFPATGYVAPDYDTAGWAMSLVLPVTAVLIGAVANSAQQFRGAMIDVLNQDYIRTLRTRGISERNIIFRHALRNAASPGLTILSLQTIALMGGVIVIEQVFALPGMGVLIGSAALQGDIPAVMGDVLFIVIVVVVVNIIVDLLNGWVNPKARIS